MRWLVVSAAVLLALTSAATAKEPARAKAVVPVPEVKVETAYDLMTTDPLSTETARFLVRNWPEHTPDAPPKEVKTGVLVVYLEGSHPPVEGASYVLIDRRTDCATKAFTASYTAHAADGTVVGQGASLPPEIALFAESPSFDGTAQFNCTVTTKTPVVYAPAPSHPDLDVRYQRWDYAKDIPGALALARERAAMIVAARNLPEAGRYMYVAGVPGHEAALLDTSNINEAGGAKRISWLVVLRAQNNYDADHMRVSFDVDCDKHVATQAMIAQFDADNRLIRVAGAGQANSFGRFSGNVSGVLKDACESDGPRMFDRTYKTVTKALARGREAVAP